MTSPRLGKFQRTSSGRAKSPRRGRPKGQTNDKKSYGPLGDLIRRQRIEKKMGLSQVAKACGCSVQFISNIEHGRAPLPWEKAEKLAAVLELSLSNLQAANLSIRSDFQKFASSGRSSRARRKSKASRGGATPFSDTTSLPTDPEFQFLIQKYMSSSEERRRAFLHQAKELL